MRHLKMGVRQENGLLSLTCGKWGVTNDVMFAYVHTKINILRYVMRIVFFLSYDFN